MSVLEGLGVKISLRSLRRRGDISERTSYDITMVDPNQKNPQEIPKRQSSPVSAIHLGDRALEKSRCSSVTLKTRCIGPDSHES